MEIMPTVRLLNCPCCRQPESWSGLEKTRRSIFDVALGAVRRYLPGVGVHEQLSLKRIIHGGRVGPCKLGFFKSRVKTAVASYRASMPAFTRTSIPADDEIKEHLAADAQILKLAEPVNSSKVFDFSLQREVNRDLGIK